MFAVVSPVLVFTLSILEVGEVTVTPLPDGPAALGRRSGGGNEFHPYTAGNTAHHVPNGAVPQCLGRKLDGGVIT